MSEVREMFVEKNKATVPVHYNNNNNNHFIYSWLKHSVF